MHVHGRNSGSSWASTDLANEVVTEGRGAPRGGGSTSWGAGHIGRAHNHDPLPLNFASSQPGPATLAIISTQGNRILIIH